MMCMNRSVNCSSLIRTMVYYAVARGKQIGIYDSWSKCEQQVKGFKGAKYKKFPTLNEAELFIKSVESSFVSSTKRTTYDPVGESVPLGVKSSSSICSKDEVIENEIEHVQKKQAEEFWPNSDGDSFIENALTDQELLAAVAEVEGWENSAVTSRKRKGTEPISHSGKLAKLDSKILQPAGIKNIGNLEFLLDDEGYVIVYTDGSCLNNGAENACAGFGVYFGDDHPLNAAKPVLGRVTNNVGEIQAAIYAIKTAKDLRIKKLCISTDSQFLIKAINCWVQTWKKKNWRLVDGTPVKNVVDFKELDELLSDKVLDVKWNYVKAHKGIKGNEMADKLAREGSNKYRRMKNNLVKDECSK